MAEVTLGDALADPGLVPEDHWVLLPRERPWTVATQVRTEDLDAADEDPDDDAVELDGATFHDILENLLEQRQHADLEDRLRALTYYIENDAFVQLDAG